MTAPPENVTLAVIAEMRSVAADMLEDKECAWHAELTQWADRLESAQPAAPVAVAWRWTGGMAEALEDTKWRNAPPPSSETIAEVAKQTLCGIEYAYTHPAPAAGGVDALRIVRELAELQNSDLDDADLVKLERLTDEAAAIIAGAGTAWVDSNMTFFDVDHSQPTNAPNVPALASVSKRIWYHATDDVTSFPFSAVIANAVSEGKNDGNR